MIIEIVGVGLKLLVISKMVNARNNIKLKTFMKLIFIE